MDDLLRRRQEAWEASLNAGIKHDQTTRKKAWKSIAARIASEKAHRKLYDEWHVLNALCCDLGLLPMDAWTMMMGWRKTAKGDWIKDRFQDGPVESSEPQGGQLFK